MRLDVLAGGLGPEGLDPKLADIFLDLDHVLFRFGNDGREGFIFAHRLSGISSHLMTGRGWCYGTIWTDGRHGTNWEVLNQRPLTIMPSVLCACGHHGFVRDGKWVPS